MFEHKHQTQYYLITVIIEGYFVPYFKALSQRMYDLNIVLQIKRVLKKAFGSWDQTRNGETKDDDLVMG